MLVRRAIVAMFWPRIIGLLASFGLLIATCTVYGQSSFISPQKSDTISVAFIEINEGLSQGMINDVCEDHEGYLWVGTKDGLNRYDGLGFQVFNNDLLDSTSLSNNFIYSLLVDKHNRLWLGTQNSGIDLYDPNHSNFIHFQSKKGDENSLTSDFIGELYEDHKGNILAESLDEHGFNVILMSELGNEYPNSSQVSVKPIREVYPVFDQMQRSEHHSKHLNFDAFGGMWYLNRDTIYYCSEKDYSGKTKPKVYSLIIGQQKSLNDDNYLLFSQNKDQVFASDGERILFEFNFETERFEPVFELPEPYSFWNRQFLDTHGRVWSWMEGGEGFRIDLTDLTFSRLNLNWDKLNLLSKDMHTGIEIEDKNNNLWLGTGGNGLLKISATGEWFKRSIPIERMQKGSLKLFRTESRGGNSLFNEKAIDETLLFIEHLEASKLNLSWINLLGNLVLDSNGNYWACGLRNEGETVCLFRYNMTNPPYFEVVYERPYIHEEMFGTPIFLDNNENIWFGDRYSNGKANLFKYNKESKELKKFTFPKAASKFQYRFISDAFCDDNDEIWMATMSGVFRFDEATEHWTHYQHRLEDKSSLSSNQTLAICKDPHHPEQFIWVGTEGAGLNRVNIETGKAERFTQENGLPNNVVYSIQSDHEKNLWFGTNKGLCLFNTSTFKCRTFTKEDGLPSDEFNRYEYSRSLSGELFFGGMGGVVKFNPEDFYKTKEPSKTVITYLMLFNELVTVGDQELLNKYGFELEKPIEISENLIFSHTHDMITFGFANLDLTTPSSNKFKYKLEGFHTNWIEAGHRSEATFTDLSPGDYTLHVAGTSNEEYVNIKPTTLSFSVTPPWYATWWAILIGLLFIFSLLYTFYRVRVASLLKFERMRNRIAQDLHDEIGSTLSSISLYSSALTKSHASLPNSATDILDKIENSTTEIMDSMNDIVWTIKSENDDFVEVLNRIRAFASNVAETKGIRLKMEVAPAAKALKLNMNIRKEVYLILKELIINAVKYAQCEIIEIKVDYEYQNLIIEVADDGVGFEFNSENKTKTTLGGNGIIGVHFRAKEIGGEVKFHSLKGEGTNVVLRCPLK